MLRREDLQNGDRVLIAGGFGTEMPIEAVVNSICEDCSGTVIDYYDETRKMWRWCRLRQIVRKLERAA